MKPFLGFFQNIGWPELLVILVLVLIVFGPRRLPDIAEAFGKSIRKFRTATNSAADEVKRELDAAAGEKNRDAGQTPPERKDKTESTP
jgi:sec-independent protein translocase protein TatA